MWKHGPGEGRPCKNLFEHGDKEGETAAEGGIDPDAPLHSVEGVAGVVTPAGGGALKPLAQRPIQQRAARASPGSLCVRAAKRPLPFRGAWPYSGRRPWTLGRVDAG
jgi:hypothetical protein